MSGRLHARIADDMKAALKAGDKDRVQVLRMLIAALQNRELELGRDDLDEAGEIAVIDKAAKMRKDAIAQAESVGRDDVAERERRELPIIEAYLPRRLTPAELAAAVRALAAEVGYQGPKDTGKFMKAWMARYQGQADGKDVQAALKDL